MADFIPQTDAGLLAFTLVPEEMQSPSVDRAFFIGAGVGYVRVSSFEEKTPDQLKEAIEKLGPRLRYAGLDFDTYNRLVPQVVECCATPVTPAQLRACLPVPERAST